MPNTYVTLPMLTGTGALNFGTSTAFNTRVLQLSENISREIEQYTNRFYYPLIGTFTFDGDGSRELMVPDLISVSTLLEDTNYDGTYETGWASTDYLLYPQNAAPTSEWGRPYRSIFVNPASNGTQDTFLKGLKNYQVAGTWGWSRVLDSTGVPTISSTGTINSTATSVTLSATSGTYIETGHLIVIDSEMMYVTSATSTGTALTVRRAQNGAAGTNHASSAAISVIRYPGAVMEAVFIQVARLWQRRTSGFATEVGIPETGQMMVWRGGLDADVKALLSPYRKLAI